MKIRLRKFLTYGPEFVYQVSTIDALVPFVGQVSQLDLYSCADSNDSSSSVINTSAVSSAPSLEKYNPPPSQLPQQAPVIPPLTMPPTCSTTAAPVVAPPKEPVVPSVMPSVFDPVLESPPQIMAPSTNNVAKFDKPPALVSATTNAMHSASGRLRATFFLASARWSLNSGCTDTDARVDLIFLSDKMNTSLSPNGSLNFNANDSRGSASLTQPVKKVSSWTFPLCSFRLAA